MNNNKNKPKTVLMADYENFKESYKKSNPKETKEECDLHFSKPEALLAFLFSKNGIKLSQRKTYENVERTEEVKKVFSGMLNIKGMTVDVVLDAAIKRVSELTTEEEKKQVLLDAEFLLSEWAKLNLSDAEKERIGITELLSKKSEKVNQLVGNIYSDSEKEEMIGVFYLDVLPENEVPPPQPPPEQKDVSDPIKMATVFEAIDLAKVDNNVLNSEHIKGLSNHLWNAFAEVYSKIKQDEFYSKERGPNVNKFDGFLDLLADSVEMNILNGKNESAVKNRTLFYLKLAEDCFESGNLQAAQAILATLENIKMQPIFLEILSTYKNKAKIEEILSILFSNKSNSNEVDEKSNNIGRGYIELRQYLKKHTNDPCMPSFVIESFDEGHYHSSKDALLDSFNFGKMLKAVSKRVALVKQISAQNLYPSDKNYPLLEAQPSSQTSSQRETKIMLYPERQNGSPPTCQSIVASLSKVDGKLLFKAVLIVGELKKEKEYGFGQDERYTVLLGFIANKIKEESCSAEEYGAARELLQAIEAHAKTNGKKEVIKQVKAFSNRFSKLEQAKQKAINVLGNLKNYSGAQLVKSISEDKDYRELKELIKKRAPEERKKLMEFIAAQKTTNPELKQHISIFEVLLKKDANVTLAVSLFLSEKSGPPALPPFANKLFALTVAPPSKLIEIEKKLGDFTGVKLSSVTEGPITFTAKTSEENKTVTWSMTPGNMGNNKTSENENVYNALVTSIFESLGAVKPSSTEANPFIITLAKGLDENKAEGLIEAIQVERLKNPLINIAFFDQKNELVPKPLVLTGKPDNPKLP